MATELVVAGQWADGTLVLRLAGVLAGGPADRAQVDDAVAAVAPPQMVVFDLTGLRLFAAAGVRTLRAVLETLDGRGVRCRIVVEPAGAVATVVGLASLSPAVDVFPTLDDALVAGLTSLTRMMVAESTVGAVLDRIVTAARIVVPGANLVSVTVCDGAGGLFTAARTGPDAGTLDQAQYVDGGGPCVDVGRPDGPGYVTADDLTTDRRWPVFARVATDHGFAAVLSIDLAPADGTVVDSGTLNIYARRAGGLPPDPWQAALPLAAHATLAIADTGATELFELRAHPVRGTIATRDVIDRVRHLLMTRQGVTAGQAFDLLRRTSDGLPDKLVDLAHALAGHGG